MNIKAIIFDWGRTLYSSDLKSEFPESDDVLSFCKERGYRLAVASLVSAHANATLEERKHQIENSPLRHYFEFSAVTDGNKDDILDQLVNEINLPREEILIVDDRMIRGIKYGNLRGHPTVWLQKGKFENETPDEETKNPTHIIHSLIELKDIV